MRALSQKPMFLSPVQADSIHCNDVHVAVYATPAKLEFSHFSQVLGQPVATRCLHCRVMIHKTPLTPAAQRLLAVKVTLSL